MKIAAAVNGNFEGAYISEVFEDAVGFLMIETDTMEAEAYVTEDLLNELERWDCEAILCGDMYDANLFENIARKGITRYYAGGLAPIEAAEKMMRYELPHIVDYVGGNGCGSHIPEKDRKCTGACGAD